MFHSQVLIGANHILHQWAYADATARQAASGFIATDVGKVALQQDDGSYWILADTTPTWWPLSPAGALRLTITQLGALHTGLTAVPGRFYQDSTNNTVYVGQADGSLISLVSGEAPPVIQAGWTDLRFADYGTLGTQVTTGVTLNKDPIKGAHVTTSTTSWNQGVKFMAAQWARTAGSTLSIVIRKDIQSLQGMLGLVDATANINGLTGIYQGEICAWVGTTSISRCYGQDSTGANALKFFTGAPISAPMYYRMDFPIGPGLGMGGLFVLSQVDPTDWNTIITTLYTSPAWGLTIGGMAAQLVPFWIAYQSSTDGYYWAGYKVV
jgi:hypothetical protein